MKYVFASIMGQSNKFIFIKYAFKGKHGDLVVNKETGEAFNAAW